MSNIEITARKTNPKVSAQEFATNDLGLATLIAMNCNLAFLRCGSDERGYVIFVFADPHGIGHNVAKDYEAGSLDGSLNPDKLEFMLHTVSQVDVVCDNCAEHRHH